MLTARQRAAIRRTSFQDPLQGRVSFNREPTATQYRFLVLALALHGPGTTKFQPVSMPLDFILGPLLVSASPEAVERAVWGIFGSGTPLLRVEEVDAAGQVLKKGSWRIMPLLSSLSYRSGKAYLVGRANDCLLDYLPQLLALLPPEVLEGLPLVHRLRRLAA